MRRFLCLGMTLVGLLSAKSAWALVDGQAYVGQQWYSLSAASDINVSGSEFGVGVHFDPLPLVPVAVGASFSAVSLDKEAFSPSADLAGFSALHLDIIAWVPMVPVVTPFARLKYNLSGKLKVEYADPTKDDIDADVSGYHLSVGLKYGLIPLLSLTLEVGQGYQKADKVDGSERDLNSSFVGVGLEVRI